MTRSAPPPTGRRRARRVRPRRRLARLITTIGVVAGVTATATIATVPATAAVAGVGWGHFTNENWDVPFKGTFAEDGILAICAEKGKDYPTDPLVDLGLVDSARINQLSAGQTGEHPAVTPDQVAGINRVLHEYVETTDRNEAAALEYAVHRVLSPDHSYRSVAGTVHATYDAVIAEDMMPSAGPQNIAIIQSLADAMVQAINSTIAMTDNVGSGSLVFTTDESEPHAGTVTMVGTEESVGTITLTNGVFATTGSEVLTDAEANVAYPILGVAPAGTGTYRISGTFEFTPTGETGYAPLVRMMGASNPGQQTAVTVGPTTSNVPFTGAGEDAAPRSFMFQPTFTSMAPRFFEPGEPFIDTLRFSTVPGADGTHNPWFEENGAAVEITAHATVYGPFAEAGADWPLAHAPADAPIAGHMSLTTGPLGPTIDYTVTSDERASASGVYTIVWVTDASQYGDHARQYVPADWVFTDAFGLADETGTVPMQLTGTSRAGDPVAPGGVPGDTVTITGNGLWLTQSGENVPVVLRWDAYHDPREASAIAEVDATEIPAEAMLLGSVTTTISDVGEVATPGSAEALGFTAPTTGGGSIVWVPSIRDADQGDLAPLIEEWSERYGVASQIQPILPPDVPISAPPASQRPLLAATGSDVPLAVALLGVGLLSAGALAVLSSRRRATSHRRA